MPDPTDPTVPAPPGRRAPVSDDVAYLLPMGTFLALIMVGGKLGADTPAGNTAYPWAYAARALVVAVMLVLFWPAYTRVRWHHWWLGVVVGVVGIVQWVGMQAWLEQFEFFRSKTPPFNPDLFFEGNPVGWWLFVGVRLFGAVLVVPVMEELFWRDYAWRTVVAPNDFKLAEVGEWDWKAFVVVPVVFSFVHLNWALTSVVWAFLVGGLLAYTRSLGACIVAHATTNLLLGAWVLWRKDWGLW